MAMLQDGCVLPSQAHGTLASPFVSRGAGFLENKHLSRQDVLKELLVSSHSGDKGGRGSGTGGSKIDEEKKHPAMRSSVPFAKPAASSSHDQKLEKQFAEGRRTMTGKEGLRVFLVGSSHETHVCHMQSAAGVPAHIHTYTHS